jgi:hypothetical protein
MLLILLYHSSILLPQSTLITQHEPCMQLLLLYPCTHIWPFAGHLTFGQVRLAALLVSGNCLTWTSIS